ncbi:MAG TPA: 3-deoxy-7-phosphoheptulonate synthase, partial [Candidatus Binataceae bacterium]|nr:3-deoxy-7-phosphoheptulonate synthase [Candidatus Binataceae bacterium]
LARATSRFPDELCIVMRVYFEKPRTTVGWKGLINDPHLDGSCAVGEGLELARRILLDVNRLGVPCGSELLDPITPQYVADLLSWAAIGARTTIGWKGLINDPHMDDSCDITAGLRVARELLLQINRMGLAAATETLDPITPQYIADLISWSAIGARTTESQTHREMASGLSMPVGFKNSTEGNLQVAIDAIQSARRPHSFLGITQDGLTAIVRTSGNPDTHIVLRGGRTPNYDARSIAGCEQMLAKAGVEARVMVDCSHAQTNKDYRKQPAVFETLVEQVRSGSRAIMGVMLESNLEAGNQPLRDDPKALKYGVSITDPCIDWATTERCLMDAAGALSSPQSAAIHG